jgi:hypothetical protein
MKRLAGYSTAFHTVGMLWYESREDLSIFCYRVGCDLFATICERTSGLTEDEAVAGTSGETRSRARIHSPLSTLSL